MPMGSGGGGGGGAVVGGPSPWSAMQAAQYQAAASQAAAQAATQQTQDAINLIRQQYTNAFISLKPYTSEGIQALNELNAYMGLNAYNPGTAPQAPKAPTMEEAGKDISYFDKYMRTMAYTSPTRTPSGFNALSYGGPLSSTAMPASQVAAGKQWGYGGAKPVSLNPGGGSIGDLMSLTPIVEGVAGELTNEKYRAMEKDYESQLPMYNQQMDLYNQAKTAYDNYGGPYTPEQVQAKLMAQPGVGFQYNQGLDAIQRAASAKGQIGSGRVLQALADYGQGVASQQYGATLQRLAGLVEMGQNAATNQASSSMNLGNLTGQLTNDLGSTLANSFLARGNAFAQGTLAANQQYKVIGGDSGGGGMGGLGSLLGGAASLMGSGSGGSGLLGMFSDRKLKDIIAKPSTQEILESVKKLNIDRWKYKGLAAEHIGPYADEFKDHFGIGDGKTINIIDYLGVLTASIKELAIKLDRIETRIK